MPVVEEMPVPATRVTAREILAAVGLAVLGFVLGAGVLHAAIRNPLQLHADMRSEKLVMMDRWHGKVFSAMFGTSHIHNGFDPASFDRVLAGSPLATRSANFGIEGGSQSEQFVMAQQFLTHLESPKQAGAAPQPCLVMLELSAGSNFTNDHLVHPRAINIYDVATTRLVTHFASPDLSAAQRYGRVGFALAAMAMHYSNVGMLSNRIFAPPLNSEMLDTQGTDGMRGLDLLPYHPLDLPYMYAIVARRPKQPAIDTGQMYAGNSEMVERLAAASPVRHVSFAYVVMPKLNDLASGSEYPDHLTVTGPEGPIDVPIINMARADRFPQLYSPEIWFDDGHLNGTGARMFSELLADHLKSWYATHGGPPPCG